MALEIRRVGGGSRPISSSQRCAHSAVTGDSTCAVMKVQCLEAHLAGWDPTTSLALLRVAHTHTQHTHRTCRRAHDARNCTITRRPSRARDRTIWRNALSASAGIVSVIGGPLRTGRRREIDQVLRTTAPMHDGFAGGALVDTTGALLGIITSTRIRGTTVVIPASIAWKTASSVLEHGGLKRGYLGIAGQPVRLPANLSRPAGLPPKPWRRRGCSSQPSHRRVPRPRAVSSWATSFWRWIRTRSSRRRISSTAVGERDGSEVRLDVLRGGVAKQLPITVGERPKDR